MIKWYRYCKSRYEKFSVWGALEFIDLASSDKLKIANLN